MRKRKSKKGKLGLGTGTHLPEKPGLPEKNRHKRQRQTNWLRVRTNSCSRHIKQPGQAPSAPSTPALRGGNYTAAPPRPQPLLRDTTLGMIEEFSSREQKAACTASGPHPTTGGCVPDIGMSTSTGGTPAMPDLMLAHRNTLPRHGKHPTSTYYWRRWPT